MHKTLSRAEKIATRIDELASISEDPSGITRRYGTAAYLEAANKVLSWMRSAGLQARMDHIGNIRGRWESNVPGARTLVIASHIDTVPDAGRWDGPLGVVMGLDLLENIIQSGQQLPFHIELIAFCDEEGARYHTTYLGSKVVTGSFERELLERRDEAGVTLEEAMASIGGDAAKLDEDAIEPEDWLGYFEIHIEQGPVLYERNIPAAAVSAIAGQIRAEVVFKGEAGHAGTVPMASRRDALCGASEFILELEKLALGLGLDVGRQSRGGHGMDDGLVQLVATVGKLQIRNPASNVIPGEVTCSVDIRSADEQVLSRAHEQIRELSRATGLRRKLTVDWKVLQASAPVVCNAGMQEALGRAIEAAGYAALSLVSGAGHDAVPVSTVSPVAMLFVRCYKGISHHPLEKVETEDLAAVVAILDNFIQQLSATWKYQH